MNKIQLEMIDKFQCPGCSLGIDTKQCSSFQFNSCESPNLFNCTKHSPGTIVSGVGSFVLGLPKGFNQLGVIEWEKCGTYIRLYEKPEDAKNVWNKFNLATWAMEKDGYLFVKTFSPRVNWMFVDVIKGGTLDLVPDAIDASKVDMSKCF